MSSIVLDQFLYNEQLKKVVNYLLENKFIYKNPIYQYFLKKKIKDVVYKYRNKPFLLRIENTNVCNSKCLMCPHSTMKRKQGYMDKDLYEKIINEASELGIDFITIHNFGEPLLDKNFIWRVEYAKQKGIKRITTNTNAQVMDEKLSLQLIKSGLDTVFVSLDAASEPVYNKIRIGLNYKKVVNNIKMIIKLKKEMKSDTPEVVVDFLESDLNRHEKQLFINNWNDLADKVCISKMHDWNSKKHEMAKFDYDNYISFSQAPCRLPFTDLSINWTGKVSICCQDVEEKFIVGDCNKQTIKEIWNGHKLNLIRKNLLDFNLKQLPLCNKCKLRTFWWYF